MNQNQFNYNMMFQQNIPQYNPMIQNYYLYCLQQQNISNPLFNNLNMNNIINQNIMMNNLNNNFWMNMNTNQCAMIPKCENMANFGLNNNNQNNFKNPFVNNNINNNNNCIFNNNCNNQGILMNLETNNIKQGINNFFLNNNIQNCMNINQKIIKNSTNNNITKELNNLFSIKTSSLFETNYEELLTKIELINMTNYFNYDKENIIKTTPKLFINRENSKFVKEIEIIINKVKSIFNQENLSKLINEKDLLNYFSKKEKECIEFINENFAGEIHLKKFIIGKIKEIFYKKNQIHNIAKNVITKINKIENENIQSEQEFKANINIFFPGIDVPNFLIEGPLKNLRSKLFYSERNKKTTILINNIKNKHIIEDSKKLVLFLEKIKSNTNLIFEGIICKMELLYFFILVNYDNFMKKFYNNELLILLKINESIIKKYFSESFDYSKLYEEFKSMTENERNSQINLLFSIIKMEINQKKDVVFNIIASFFYLLFYTFKVSKFSKEITNLGNPYINIILKVFVIILDKKFNNQIKIENNFYELLKDLYISDINNLINEEIYSSKNLGYSFEALDIILLNNERVKNFYIDLKEKYTQSGYFSKYGKLGPDRNFTTFELLIKLIPFEENVFCNTITIIIDGFLNENSNPLDKWINFIKYYKKESMFYFYKWPSDSFSNIVSNIVNIFNIFKTGKIFNDPCSQFKCASLRAEISGKILAYIIYSNTIFNGFQINLVGFSLGNHVIHHCIKELYRLNHNFININNPILLQNLENNCEVNLKNVIFCAAATTFEKEDNWGEYIRETIIDKFKNIYAKNDWALGIYNSIMDKTAIGIKELDIKYEGKNIITNYDFTKYTFGHNFYKMGLVAEKISGHYKEI